MFHPRRRFRPLRAAGPVAALCLAAVVVVGFESGRPAAAQPRAGRPALAYVPADAAGFVHVDVAKVWNHPAVKAVRDADTEAIGPAVAQAKHLFGVTPDDLESVTVFVPKLKGPEDTERAGVVLAFNKPFDAAKLTAGLDKLLGNGVPHRVHTPSDKLAVVLIGLGDEYAKPRPADATGPLTPALRDAATGSHVLVAGTTLASMPDELRGAPLPGPFEDLRPLLKADAITVRVDVGADVGVDLRVKTQTPAQALDAEKALGVLARLLQDALDEGLKELGPDAREALTKDLAAVMSAAKKSLQGTKFSAEGTEARAVVRVPLDLPYTNAYLAAVKKVRDAAAGAQSANNLKQLALALHSYHDVNGALPPAAVCDKAGKPLLSWRVLVLPYVEANNVYQEFKLDEPWDSEHNKKLLARMPNVYRLPGQKADDTRTHYRVFVGNGAAFDYVTGHKLQNFADGTSNTYLVVTAADAVPWSKPDELAFDPDKDPSKLLGLVVNGKAQVAMADGSVRSYGKLPSRRTLTAYITRDGGETVVDDDR